MAQQLDISFKKNAPKNTELLIVFADKDVKLSAGAGALVPDELLENAASAGNFTGKSLSTLDVIAPSGIDAKRLVVIGVGDGDDAKLTDWTNLGGKIGGIAKSAGLKEAAVIAERPDGEAMTAEQLAAIAGGAKLRTYTFDNYKTKKADDDTDKNKNKDIDLAIVTDLAKEADDFWKLEAGVFDGCCLARDLVNEPANMLGPVEFADRAKALEKLGVEVEILTEKEMTKLKMGALLGVSQGSVRPPRMAIMKWMGGKKGEKPISFVGKGVVFDTGGISIKPAGGMEDMKGDMGGAAAVTGVMHALAARKAKANVIGVIGLVENMPDGNAQRPGDIVTSMSGQTIEVINTDAEGRLVLCDALHYVKEEYDPEFMVNLATLTGAVIVALGHHHAGMFCNDDELALKLAGAGEVTGELLWRLPMGKAYDKQIDSKFADMKNVGSRAGGSITAAQFLKRFVGETPWAHLDIAGTGFGSPQTEINKSWASGYGVRLLDRLVRDNYEG